MKRSSCRSFFLGAAMLFLASFAFAAQPADNGQYFTNQAVAYTLTFADLHTPAAVVESTKQMQAVPVVRSYRLANSATNGALPCAGELADVRLKLHERFHGRLQS